MNFVPVNAVINSLAAAQSAQSRGDAERNSQEISAQQRVAQLSAGAEQVHGESSTEERDADGRLPYQRPGQRRGQDGTLPGEPAQPPVDAELLVKDPSGEVGGELDILG